MPTPCTRDTATLALYTSTMPSLETLNCPQRRLLRPKTSQLRAPLHVVVRPRGIEWWPAFVPLDSAHLTGGRR